MKGLLKLLVYVIDAVDLIDGWISGRVKGRFGEKFLNRYSKRNHIVMHKIYPILGADTPGTFIINCK